MSIVRQGGASGRDVRCSFCGKEPREVKKLIAGLKVHICDECVGLCNEILAEDISFPEDVYETDAGAVGIVYENVGQIRHTLVIEGEDGFKLDVSTNGDVDQGIIDLEPGTYRLICDVPGHRPAGMVADLVVS